MKLNARQQQFVEEYLIDKNATRAASAAGYSSKTAHSTGPRMLENAGIKAAIEKGLAAQVKTIQKRAAARGITKERWLRELEIIAFTNIDDVIVIDTYEREQGTDGEVIEVVRTMPIPTANRPRYLGKAIKKINETKNGIGIELHSKQAALDTIGKHYGWVKNEIELNDKTNKPKVVLMIPSNGFEAASTDDASLPAANIDPVPSTEGESNG